MKLKLTRLGDLKKEKNVDTQYSSHFNTMHSSKLFFMSFLSQKVYLCQESKEIN